jgi:uncharacterized membrane protein
MLVYKTLDTLSRSARLFAMSDLPIHGAPKINIIMGVRFE